MRYLPKALVLAALVTVQVVVSAAFSAGTLTNLYAGKISPGVYVGNLSAAGLSASSLRQAAVKVFPAESTGLSLILDGDGKKWAIPYANLEASSNLGLLLDNAAAHLDNGSPAAALRILRLLGRPLHLQPGFIYQHGLLTAQLAAINQQVAVPPQNAYLTLTGDKVTVVPAKPGRQLDIATTVTAVGPVLSLEGQTSPLVFAATAPGISDAQLAPLQNLLASYHTELITDQTDRNHNLRLAAQLLDGTLMQPGEVFSLNARLGRRTNADGFRQAPAIVNDTLVDQTGGGICQIATTLYNAALLAGLKVTERHPHSLPVPYAPLGLDATINWDNLDLKLADDTGYPVYIAAGVQDNSLTIRIFGERTQPGQVSVYTRVATPDGHPLPPLTELALGSDSQDTISVTVYRRVSLPDAQATTALISHDYYHVANNLPGQEK
ncbi:MAG TPA: VanW family protein [Spirochaetia bacterium]|nr:VanW family protein [Spirochaetia bacterium]